MAGFGELELSGRPKAFHKHKVDVTEFQSTMNAPFLTELLNLTYLDSKKIFEYTEVKTYFICFLKIKFF